MKTGLESKANSPTLIEATELTCMSTKQINSYITMQTYKVRDLIVVYCNDIKKPTDHVDFYMGNKLPVTVYIHGERNVTLNDLQRSV